MRYQTGKLGDHVQILSGFAFKSKDFSDEGIPVIKIKNVTPPSVSLIDLSYIPEEIADRNNRFILDYDDVLIALTGSHINQMASVVGRVARVKYSEKTVLNQRVGKITAIDPDDCDINFVYYYLSQDQVKIELASKAGGAANQANISPTDIKNLMIPFPEIGVQRKISAVLRTYDDLIENNQKQIKLLEEAAQRLYKEWFVDLRFPGHETTLITDGIPEGWNLTNINAVMTFHRGYDLTKNNMIHGKYPVVGSTSIIGYHNQYKVHGPGIITGRSGSLGEYQLIWEDYWPHNTSLYVSDMKGHHVLYLYSMLQTVDFSGLNNGGAIPTLNRNTLSNIPVIEASKALQNEYVRVVEPIYSAIRTVKRQIEYLQEARDRLLPKLMNGEIEV